MIPAHEIEQRATIISSLCGGGAAWPWDLVLTVQDAIALDADLVAAVEGTWLALLRDDVAAAYVERQGVDLPSGRTPDGRIAAVAYDPQRWELTLEPSPRPRNTPGGLRSVGRHMPPEMALRDTPGGTGYFGILLTEKTGRFLLLDFTKIEAVGPAEDGAPAPS